MAKGSVIDQREARVAGAVATGVVAIVLFRAVFGASLYDDTYYVTTALRFANGARPFAEEMSLQALGQLLSVPFVWAWQATFGLTGIMLAVRIYYVALATGAAAVTYRLLRPTLRPAAAAVAVTLPLLAPPYHLLMPTYNTMAVLAFTLAIALGFGALRDGHTAPAVWSGVLLAVGPLAPPALTVPAPRVFVQFPSASRLPHAPGGGGPVERAGSVLACGCLAVQRVEGRPVNEARDAGKHEGDGKRRH